KNGKERISIEQLMTHRAGLPPDNEIADYVGKTVDPLPMIYELRPSYEPGTRFVYSDVGFIVAAEVVRRVSGKRIDEFADENIFKPAGMNHTGFITRRMLWAAQRISEDARTPGRGDVTPEKLNEMIAIYERAPVDSIAPTEMRDGHWMRGEVHDPRAYEMG